MTLKAKVAGTPVVGAAARGLWQATLPVRLRIAGFQSAGYWDSRYVAGGNSGVGSYGELAEFKARVLNGFVAERQVKSVIELGCGDGNQLSLARYPIYMGYDVSPSAIKRCQEQFGGDPSKRFVLLDEACTFNRMAEMALSLDVIYHLVEDRVYERHMESLFRAATRFVIIYSDNEDLPRQWAHIRHRRFSDWIEQNRLKWRLVEHIPNAFPYDPDLKHGSWADFRIYASERNR
jgi:SAM-dependent methyltransferase